MNLTNKLKKGLEIDQEYFSNIFNLIQSGTHIALGTYGEYLQQKASKELAEPSWMAGHLSDISMVATSVALGLIIAGKNKVTKYLAALVPPIACTLHEFNILNLNKGATYYDFQDVLCYWGGAALTLGISKYVSNKLK